jgi:hypothetical protein
LLIKLRIRISANCIAQPQNISNCKSIVIDIPIINSITVLNNYHCWRNTKTVTYSIPRRKVTRISHNREPCIWIRTHSRGDYPIGVARPCSVGFPVPMRHKHLYCCLDRFPTVPSVVVVNPSDPKVESKV